MLNFIPFRALRPRPEHAASISGSSEDFDSTDSLAAFLRENPLNVLRLTKMDLVMDGIDQNKQAYYAELRNFSHRLSSARELIRDETPAFYIYRQLIHGVPHTGIVGLIDVENLMQGQIKRHEHTRSEREKFIGVLFEEAGLISQPVLLGHRHHEQLETFALQYTLNHPPVLDFSHNDVIHQIWQIDDEQTIDLVRSLLREIPSLYIMDGHHRIATVARLYGERPDEGHRYLPAYLLDEFQLQIDPFHRLVDAPDLKPEDLLSNLTTDYEVTQLETPILESPGHGTFILLIEKNCYRLKARDPYKYELDVQLFEESILKKQFGIDDSRNDLRLSFRKNRDIVNNHRTGFTNPGQFLFLLHPCSFQEIKRVSDRGEVMPPKSTSIEPKGRNGLLMCIYGRQKPMYVR